VLARARAEIRPQDWGIQPVYRDWAGRRKRAPRSTVERMLSALGANQQSPGHAAAPIVVRKGEGIPVAPAVDVRTEDGRSLSHERVRSGDLPTGYHELARGDGSVVPLIVSPGRCLLPPAAQAYGFAAQLYASRSRRSWGIGDLGDLRTLASWATRLDAAMLQLNPLHAVLPGSPQQPSPYFPSSRRYRNPLYIRVEDVRGAELVALDLEPLARAARALLDDRRIDRDAVYALKMAALERIWEAVGDVPELDGYVADDPGVLRFATFCALMESHGTPWRRWPEEIRHPAAPGVELFRRNSHRRVRFHVWLQWLLDSQLRAAAATGGVVHDLAVGVDPDGADAWEWQRLWIDAAAIGAPPDQFNTLGQNWGLCNAGYRPFIETIRAAIRHAAGLRVDHVMGMFRLYLIPDGAGADRGVYVRYPHDDLLAILALESERAGAYMIGEDLGTVAPAMRRELARRNVLSSRLLWFEDGDPSTYPVHAWSAVTTHDLPTVAGLWSGIDLRMQRELGLHPNEVATRAIRDRVVAMTGIDPDAPAQDAILAVYALLARTRSMLITATLDDVLTVDERPNMPGTDRWPNWSLALPVSLEEMMAAPMTRQVAASLSRDA